MAMLKHNAKFDESMIKITEEPICEESEGRSFRLHGKLDVKK